MPINRFFIDSPLTKGAVFQLPEEERQHFKVQRIKEKDSVEIINGKNILAQGLVLSCLKSKIEIEITSLIQRQQKTDKIYLIQSYPKPSKLDFILEKGCELGVDTFIFFSSERGENKNTKEKRHKLILISGIKQCGRLDLPEILYEKTLYIPKNIQLFFGDLRKNAPFFPRQITPFPKSIGFINGPEAGFSEKEIIHFESILKAKGVSLHPNILRTETAALCALALCQIRP